MRVPGVAAAAVDESAARWDQEGLVRVRIGDVNGAASSALVNATVAEMESWRAAGVAVSVVAGTVQWIPALGIVVRLRTTAFDAGYVTTQARAAAVAACEDLAADEALYQERLDAAVWETLGGAAELRDVASSNSNGSWPLAPAPGLAWRVDPTVIAVTVIGP